MITGHDTGFWGKVDAIQDWCEPNYVVTIYVAEFFNTISTAPMILLSIAGIYYTLKIAKLNEMRYVMCFMSLIATGIGSMLFHGTLRYHFQLLDELPMMISNFVGLYTLIQSNSHSAAPMNKKVISLLSFICVVSIIGYVWFKIWIFFIITYAVGIVLNMLFYWPHFKDTSTKLLCTALLCFYGGFAFWIADLTQCQYVQPLHFHAIWHVSAGYGTYLYILSLLVMRMKKLNRDKEIKVVFQKYPPLHSIQVNMNKKM